jgi:flagella basal body P-ring formation protein FlgA
VKRNLILTLLLTFSAGTAAAGPDELTVGSEAQLETLLGRTLHRAFPDAPPRWEIVRPHRFAQDDDASFRLVLPEALTGGRNWFQLRGSGSPAKSYLLPVDLFWEDSVWVTTRALRAGDCLGAEDLAWRFARHIHPPAQTRFAPAPTGLCAERPLGAGTVLTHELLSPPPVIDRGRIVHLVYHSPGLRVAARAEALESGGLGATIRVRPLDSRSSCKGVVRSASEVEVIAP